MSDEYSFNIFLKELGRGDSYKRNSNCKNNERTLIYNIATLCMKTPQRELYILYHICYAHDLRIRRVMEDSFLHPTTFHTP